MISRNDEEFQIFNYSKIFSSSAGFWTQVRRIKYPSFNRCTNTLLFRFKWQVNYHALSTEDIRGGDLTKRERTTRNFFLWWNSNSRLGQVPNLSTTVESSLAKPCMKRRYLVSKFVQVNKEVENYFEKEKIIFVHLAQFSIMMSVRRNGIFLRNFTNFLFQSIDS